MNLQNQKNLALLLKKNGGAQLSKYLNQDEIDCKCKSNLCHFTIFRPKTIEAFERTRREFGSEIICWSGYRCQYHNKKPTVGGVVTSNHTMGDAMDITPLNGGLDALETIAKKHFLIVIRYDNFIHCDMRLFKSITST